MFTYNEREVFEIVRNALEDQYYTICECGPWYTKVIDVVKNEKQGLQKLHMTKEEYEKQLKKEEHYRLDRIDNIKDLFNKALQAERESIKEMTIRNKGKEIAEASTEQIDYLARVKARKMKDEIIKMIENI